jgi:hypothetical protein
MSAQLPIPGDEGAGKPPFNLFRLQLRKELVRSARMCARITAILRRLNPAGTGYGDTLLRYDYESRMILQRLFRCRSEADVLRAMQDVFKDRFGAKNVFSNGRFSAAAPRIWRVWQERNKAA